MKYKDKKEEARQKAIEIQYEMGNNNYSYGELAEIEDYLYRLGKRYGLLKEFKENGLL
jgi:hypothetical protein